MPGAGTGAFAARDYRKHQLIGFYPGRLVCRKQLAPTLSTDYLLLTKTDKNQVRYPMSIVWFPASSLMIHPGPDCFNTATDTYTAWTGVRLARRNTELGFDAAFTDDPMRRLNYMIRKEENCIMIPVVSPDCIQSVNRNGVIYVDPDKFSAEKMLIAVVAIKPIAAGAELGTWYGGRFAPYFQYVGWNIVKQPQVISRFDGGYCQLQVDPTQLPKRSKYKGSRRRCDTMDVSLQPPEPLDVACSLSVTTRFMGDVPPSLLFSECPGYATDESETSDSEETGEDRRELGGGELYGEESGGEELDGREWDDEESDGEEPDDVWSDHTFQPDSSEDEDFQPVKRNTKLKQKRSRRVDNAVVLHSPVCLNKQERVERLRWLMANYKAEALYHRIAVDLCEWLYSLSGKHPLSKSYSILFKTLTAAAFDHPDDGKWEGDDFLLYEFIEEYDGFGERDRYALMTFNILFHKHLQYTETRDDFVLREFCRSWLKQQKGLTALTSMLAKYRISLCNDLTYKSWNQLALEQFFRHHHLEVYPAEMEDIESLPFPTDCPRKITEYRKLTNPVVRSNGGKDGSLNRVICQYVFEKENSTKIHFVASQLKSTHMPLPEGYGPVWNTDVLCQYMLDSGLLDIDLLEHARKISASVLPRLKLDVLQLATYIRHACREGWNLGFMASLVKSPDWDETRLLLCRELKQRPLVFRTDIEGLSRQYCSTTKLSEKGRIRQEACTRALLANMAGDMNPDALVLYFRIAVTEGSLGVVTTLNDYGIAVPDTYRTTGEPAPCRWSQLHITTHVKGHMSPLLPEASAHSEPEFVMEPAPELTPGELKAVVQQVRQMFRELHTRYAASPKKVLNRMTQKLPQQQVPAPVAGNKWTIPALIQFMVCHQLIDITRPQHAECITMSSLALTDLPDETKAGYVRLCLEYGWNLHGVLMLSKTCRGERWSQKLASCLGCSELKYKYSIEDLCHKLRTLQQKRTTKKIRQAEKQGKSYRFYHEHLLVRAMIERHILGEEHSEALQAYLGLLKAQGVGNDMQAQKLRVYSIPVPASMRQEMIQKRTERAAYARVCLQQKRQERISQRQSADTREKSAQPVGGILPSKRPARHDDSDIATDDESSGSEHSLSLPSSSASQSSPRTGAEQPEESDASVETDPEASSYDPEDFPAGYPEDLPVQAEISDSNSSEADDESDSDYETRGRPKRSSPLPAATHCFRILVNDEAKRLRSELKKLALEPDSPHRSNSIGHLCGNLLRLLRSRDDSRLAHCYTELARMLSCRGIVPTDGKQWNDIMLFEFIEASGGFEEQDTYTLMTFPMLDHRLTHDQNTTVLQQFCQSWLDRRFSLQQLVRSLNRHKITPVGQPHFITWTTRSLAEYLQRYGVTPDTDTTGSCTVLPGGRDNSQSLEPLLPYAAKGHIPSLNQYLQKSTFHRNTVLSQISLTLNDSGVPVPEDCHSDKWSAAVVAMYMIKEDMLDIFRAEHAIKISWQTIADLKLEDEQFFTYMKHAIENGWSTSFLGILRNRMEDAVFFPWIINGVRTYHIVYPTPLSQLEDNYRASHAREARNRIKTELSYRAVIANADGDEFPEALRTYLEISETTTSNTVAFHLKGYGIRIPAELEAKAGNGKAGGKAGTTEWIKANIDKFRRGQSR
ncbi:hypothetical protein [Spongorhabdus nitratireducens]